MIRADEREKKIINKRREKSKKKKKKKKNRPPSDILRDVLIHAQSVRESFLASADHKATTVLIILLRSPVIY